MHAEVKASISSHERPYTPNTIDAFAICSFSLCSREADGVNVQPTSLANTHVRFSLIMRAAQQCAAPPNCLEQPRPEQTPQVLAQHIEIVVLLALVGSLSWLVTRPSLQKPPFGRA